MRRLDEDSTLGSSPVGASRWEELLVGSSVLGGDEDEFTL